MDSNQQTAAATTLPKPPDQQADAKLASGSASRVATKLENAVLFLLGHASKYADGETAAYAAQQLDGLEKELGVNKPVAVVVGPFPKTMANPNASPHFLTVDTAAQEAVAKSNGYAVVAKP